MYDLIVIGAGPGGYEAAAHAGAMGRKVALVEREGLGGTCLHAGCIPAKTFLKSARLFADCRQAGPFGVHISEARFDLPAVIQRKNRIVGTLSRGVEALLKRSRVEVIAGHARLAARNTVQVGAQSYTAGNILIATGSRPAVPSIPGIESSAVLDSTSVFHLTELPGSLAILGAGYIGLEFAGFFAAVGTQVTVFEPLPQIARGTDSEISSRLLRALQKSGVRFHTSCQVTGIDGNTVRYQDSAGAKPSFSADYILNVTGRGPVLEDMGLERLGVDFDAQGIKTSEQGRTNIPGLWACGDVTGRRLLAHAATREGIVAVNNMFGARDRIRYDAIPSVIYTRPEVASVGKTEEELKAQGVPYRKALVPMSAAARFLIENEAESGVLKVLAGARYGEVLGVHALGDLSSECIAAAVTMIEMEMCAAEARELVFPHPTVAEALKQAVQQLSYPETRQELYSNA